MAGIAIFLTSELLSISSESKKRNPEIRDAAEKLLNIIRSVKDSPKNDLSKVLAATNDLISPFFLACKSKNPKLLTPALSAILRLVSSQVIKDEHSSVEAILDSLSEASKSSLDNQLKILQTVLPLVKLYSNACGPLLFRSIELCFVLLSTNNSNLHNSASATLRQIIVYSFDKAFTSISLTPGSDSMSCVSIRDAEQIFKDLCLFLTGDPPLVLPNSPSLPKEMILEIVESLLKNHNSILISHPSFSNCVKKILTPFLICSLPEAHRFSMTIRLLRVQALLIKYFLSDLTTECEVILKICLRMIEGAPALVSGSFDVNNNSPVTSPSSPFVSLKPWFRACALEAFDLMISDSVLVCQIFEAFDCRGEDFHVLHELMSVSYAITLNIKSKDDIFCCKAPCLDQLEKFEAPIVPETYVNFLAARLIISFSRTLIELKAANTDHLASAILSNIGQCLCIGFQHLIQFTPDVIPFIKQLAILCSKIHLFSIRDSFISILALSNAYHTRCLQCILDIVDEVRDDLNESWLIVLSNFASWEAQDKQLNSQEIVSSQEINNVPNESSIFSSLISFVTNTALSSRNQSPDWIKTSAPHVEKPNASASVLNERIDLLFERTKNFSNITLSHIIQSLCLMKKHQNFSLSKLKQIVLLNTPRLQKEMLQDWKDASKYFVIIASETAPENIQISDQSAVTLCEIVTRFFGEFSNLMLISIENLLDTQQGSGPSLALETLYKMLQIYADRDIEWERVYSMLMRVSSSPFLVKNAFQTLELLCSDNLSQQPPKLCIDTLSAYAIESGDLNIAFTCIRLLWNVADTLSNELWLHVLRQMLFISTDVRVDVRNSCVTSLFRLIAGTMISRQQKITWDCCFHEIVVPILEKNIEYGAASDWEATSKLIMQGMSELVVLKFEAVPQDVLEILLERSLEFINCEFPLSVQLHAIKAIYKITVIDTLTVEQSGFALSICTKCVHQLCSRMDQFDLSDSKKPSEEMILILAKAYYDSMKIHQSTSQEKTKNIVPTNQILASLFDLQRVSFHFYPNANSIDEFSELQKVILESCDFINRIYDDGSQVSILTGKFMNLSNTKNNIDCLYMMLCKLLNQSSEWTVSRLTNGNLDSEITSELIDSIEPHICESGPMHSVCMAVFLGIMESCVVGVLPLPYQTKVSRETILKRTGKLACKFFAALPNLLAAQKSPTDEQNIHSMQRITCCLPAELEVAGFLDLLQELLSELEKSTRFNTRNPLDATLVKSIQKPDLSFKSEPYCIAGLHELFQLAARHGCAVNIAMKRARITLNQYIEDKSGCTIPLPRQREMEAHCILLQLAKLRCPTGEVAIADGLPEILKLSPAAHLYSIYWILLKCLKYTIDQEKTMDLVFKCLARCGEALGLRDQTLSQTSVEAESL